MGNVYEARHTGLDKRVALKTLHADVASELQAVARFKREGLIASRISHPNIVDITDVGVEQGMPFLVMEFLDGEDLGARIERTGPLSASDVAEIMLPVLDGLSAAHAAGVVHRDLKPENIFLASTRTEEVRAKVLDFGISKLSDANTTSSLTKTSTIMGTPCYMAPEQARSAKHADHKSDQYAVGAVLYEAVTGKRAFDQETAVEMIAALLEGTFRRPRELNTQIDPEFEAIVLRAMALRADDRYPSLRELGDALARFAPQQAQATWRSVTARARVQSDASVSAPSDGPPVAAPQATVTWPSEFDGAAPRRIRPVYLAVGAVGVLGMVFLGGAVLWSATRPVEPHARPVAATTETFEVIVTVDPPEASIEFDGERVAMGSFHRVLDIDGTEHTLRASAPGHEPVSVSFTDRAPDSQIRLTAIGVAAASAGEPTPAPGSPAAVAPPEPPPPVAPSNVQTPRPRATRPAVQPIRPARPRPMAPEPRTGRQQQPRMGINQAPILE